MANKKNKFFAVSASAALVASAIVPVAASASYNDESSIASWATESVNYVTEKGFMQGDNGNFDPKGTFTRAQAAVVAVKVRGLDTTTEFESTFGDVKEGQWFFEEVSAAAEAEIIKGSNGNFRPNDKLTRQEAAVILSKIYELDVEAADVTVLDQFSDKDSIASYATKYLAALVEADVMKGSNGKLNPTGNIARQELAVMLAKADQNLGVVAPEDDELVKALEALEEAVAAVEAIGEVTVENIEDAQAAVDALNEAIAAVEAFELAPEDEDILGLIEAVKEIAAEAQAAIDALYLVAVESVSAVNGTITVTLEEAYEEVDVENFTVTQAINGGEAKEVTPSKAELSEDGKTVTLTVPQVAQADAAQSVVYTVNGVAAKEFVVEAVAKELKVESVSATNLRTVAVTFNKEIDVNSITASTLGVTGYTKVSVFTDTSSNAKEFISTLSDDKKTVFLTFQEDTATKTYLSQGQELEIKIKDLKSTDNETVTATKKLTVLDTAVPTVTKVEQSGKNTYKVFFSEPLKTLPTVKTQSGTVSSTTVLSADGTYATVTAGADLTVGEIAVEVSNAVDYAGLPLNKTTTSFAYSIVNTVPTATVKSSTHNSVTIKFDRDLTNVQSSQVQFSNTYKGQNPVDGNSGSVEKISDSEYKVTFNNFFAPGETKVFIDYKPGTTDAQKIKDSFGNVLAPTELTVTTVADTVKPAVTNVAYDATKKLINVDFSEEISNITSATFLVRNAEGTVIANGAVAGTTDNKAVINTGTLKAGTYKVEIKGLKDKAAVPNTSDDYTTTITVADTVAPVLSSAVNIKDNVVRVTFSKDMNDADLLNAANYTFDGAPLPTGTTGPVKVNSRTVDITLPSSVTTIVGKSIVASGTMKDTLGNPIGGFASAAVAIQSTSTTAITNADIIEKSVIAVATDKVQFKLKKQLSEINKSAIKFAGDEVAAVQYSNNSDGTATVTLTLAAGKAFFNTDATVDVTTNSGITDDSKRLEIGADALVNAFGVKNGQLTEITSFEDGIAAKINKVETKDLSGNGQIDRLEVTLSESVKASSVATSDFKVEGYTVKEVISVDSSGKIVLSLFESGASDTGVTPKVTLVGELEDTKGNKGFDATNVVTGTDTAAPVLLSAITVAGDKVELTYSEEVEFSGVETQFVFDIDGAGATSADTTTDVTATGNKVVLTLTTGGLTTATDYANATITYTKATDGIKDKAASQNGAETPKTLTGVKAGF